MSENIEFVKDWFAEVEGEAGRLRQVAFRRGSRLRADVHRIGASNGVPEAANLRLADGTTALHVPLFCIAVVDQARAA
jgi:hypothetical protein